MSSHFSSFTPEAMRAFGEELAADFQARAAFLKSTRDNTFAMIAGFRKQHQEAEKNRRRRAEREADARRLFVSELRSGVHALVSRFELSRKEMAADFREMAGELRAASDAFRNRPGRHGGFSFRRGRQPSAEPPFQASAEGHDASKPPPGKKDKSEKRHG